MSKYIVWRKDTMNKTYINNKNINNLNDINLNDNTTNVNNVSNNYIFETDSIMKTQSNKWKESSLKKALCQKDYLIEIK